MCGVVALLVASTPELCAASWRKHEEEANGNAAADQYLVLKSALRPIAELTATLINGRDGAGSTTFGKVVQQAAGAAILPFPNSDQVRSVVFVLSADAQRMTALAHAGRDQRPGDFVRKVGDAGDQRGKRAFEILQDRKVVVVRDLDKEKPRTYAGSGVGYRTFITVPIVDDSGGYGLLTLDAPKAGILGGSDALLLELIAEMLSVVFASASLFDSPEVGSDLTPNGG